MNVIHSILDFLARIGLDIRVLFDDEWMGVFLWQYILAFILIVLSLFARRVATGLLGRFLPWINRVGGVYAGKIVEALSQPVTAIVGLVGVYLAVKVLVLPVSADAPVAISGEFLDQTFQVALAAVLIWGAMRLIDALSLYLRERAEENDLGVDVPVIPLLRKSLKIFVGVVGGLLVVQHMGFPIASLLGGLGIGGLAVALAAQDTLANVFGSVIVFTDRPFKVGDWVKIGDVDGDVESIGFRSTRIRTWPKSLVTIPNKEIANSRIENWSAMPKRRVKFTLMIYDDVTADQVDALVDGIREILRTHPGVNQEYVLVNFTDIAPEGLGIFLYYFTSSTVWAVHMQVRQEVNLEIMRLMERLGISLALPNTRVHLGTPAGELIEADRRRVVAGRRGMDGA